MNETTTKPVFADTIAGLREVVVRLADLSPGIWRAYREAEAFDMAEDHSGDAFAAFQAESGIETVFDLANLIRYFTEWCEFDRTPETRTAALDQALKDPELPPSVIDRLRECIAEMDDHRAEKRAWAGVPSANAPTADTPAPGAVDTASVGPAQSATEYVEALGRPLPAWFNLDVLVTAAEVAEVEIVRAQLRELFGNLIPIARRVRWATNLYGRIEQLDRDLPSGEQHDGAFEVLDHALGLDEIQDLRGVAAWLLDTQSYIGADRAPVAAERSGAGVPGLADAIDVALAELPANALVE